jgi:cobalt-zinc-cadmium efflux system membrane fusion protein
LTSLATKLQLIGINSNQINETNILKGINIYSPISGFVSKVNVNIGKYVSSTDILFELINPEDIHLNLKIFEKNLDKIFIGQPLVTYTNNHPNKKYACEIILIGKDISTEGNTEVHCHFEEYDKTLVPGTYMNAEIEVKNTKAKTLPSEAIVRFEGKQYVFKSHSKQDFEMVEVTLGETENGFSEVYFKDKEVSPDINFVTKGAYSLLMMMKNKAE